MKFTRYTWLGFIVALSALGVAKPAAARQEAVTDTPDAALETRLARVAETLKIREQQIPEDWESDVRIPNREVAGWAKGYGRGFVNNPGGGGFLKRGGWRDGGGFLNRRYY